MSRPALDTYPSSWKRPPLFIQSRTMRLAIYGGALVYLVAALWTVEVNWARVYEGLDRGWNRPPPP